METFLIRAAQLILSLSILIIMHEMGHFFFARLFKVRVERFYLFFNPSFSIFRMKKINGKWRFRWFSKNDTNIRTRFNYNGEEISEVIPPEELPDDNWKKYPESTEYGIGWLPLGGYVTIAGMIDESMNTEQMKQPVKSWEFRSKKAWQRLLIMIGGVTVNFILALVIYSAVLFTWGEAYLEMKDTPMQFSQIALDAGYKDGDIILTADGTNLGKYSEKSIMAVAEAKEVTVLRDGEEISLKMPKEGLMKRLLTEKTGLLAPYYPAVVDSVMDESNARGFLQKGDEIVGINKQEIGSFWELTNALDTIKEKNIDITVARGADTITQAVLLSDEGKIGYYNKQFLHFKVDEFTFWQSIPAGINYGIDKLGYYVNQLKFIFTKEGIKSIGSFGAIGQMFDKKWNWRSFWENTAFISIILAFMNVLPIPALDGGHVLFLLYEIIARRKPSDKFMMYAQSIGMLLLMLLFFYAISMDIIRGFFG